MTSTDLPIDRLLGGTRARVADLLRSQPRTIAALATELALSEAAVRRHLRELEQDGFVESDTVRDGTRGRPSSVYRLTDRGHRLYPQRSTELVNDLWEYLEAEHGRAALLGFLRWRRARQAARYTAGMPDDEDALEDRAHALAGMLSEDGFLARVDRTTSPQGRPQLTLTQTHCAIKDVAAAHPEICAHEAAMFRDLLGADLTRRTTIAQGADACVCHIRAGSAGSAPGPT